MKFRSTIMLLCTILLIPTLAACNTRTQTNPPTTENNGTENRVDSTGEVTQNQNENLNTPTENNIEASGNGSGSNVSSTSPNTTPATTITKEEAESIALSHAGFTSDQVSRLHTELEYDDGIYKYEIEFYQDHWEYDYDIHAEDGSILYFDKDNES